MFLSIGLLYVIKNYFQEDLDLELSQRELEEWKAEITLREKTQPVVFTKKYYEPEIKTFHFDPNQISYEEIKSLGFSEKTASNWSRFLEANGTFRQKEDLLKIYGISRERVQELWPYISLKTPEKAIHEQTLVNVEIPKQLVTPVKIDINQASAEELKKVRGIGKVLSERIVKYRDKLGGYHTTDQLSEVYGLKPEVIDRMLESFVIEQSPNKVNINIDSVELLAKHPYINYNLARAIVNFRKHHGNFNSVDDLNSIAIMNDSLLTKIQPYIAFE